MGRGSCGVKKSKKRMKSHHIVCKFMWGGGAYRAAYRTCAVSKEKFLRKGGKRASKVRLKGGRREGRERKDSFQHHAGVALTTTKKERKIKRRGVGGRKSQGEPAKTKGGILERPGSTRVRRGGAYWGGGRHSAKWLSQSPHLKRRPGS